MQEIVQIGDKKFLLFISPQHIAHTVSSIAAKINLDFAYKTPLIIPVLNGSFIFASDLAKQLTCSCQFSFIKLTSYIGISSNGQAQSLLGLNEKIEGRDILVLEDILDTGHTLSRIIEELEQQLPASIKTAALFYKPSALKTKIHLDYTGIEIPDKFIVGYGLDYNGFGRNLPAVYQVID